MRNTDGKTPADETLAATNAAKPIPCPCGGGPYALCCGRYIDSGVGSNGAPDRHPAPTAEALMRSRYTAYTQRNDAYLKATWHASTRPAEEVAQDAALKWLGLEVRRHASAGDAATVEFIARYKIAGRAHRLHEVSRFVREDGRWYYVDGSFPV